ncbi:ABC transporter permease [Alkaliphilus peptidifermentans]|uniref:ABC-type transport system, involved in lipoprotein release, permease component n=1 Tax=Alkaliphilus peptidifermentans DSM 18978 TaxID=1120976 RepID=A0A1G5K4P6_9FIRM|nr:ABC transporter permease [Alkaliphilus peptidifermentans]SCY95201.1 ABC-type transport system, involved in lipoprotein release, permease component [Alkaliphilus peptidifermentans DSM 18978]
MKSIDLIIMGFKNLWRRKLRTFLTILGVIIGTSSIVIMVSLGFGMNESFKEEISRMGSLNIINVNPPYDYYWDDSPTKRRDQPKELDDQAVNSFSSIAGVEAVTPVLETHLKITSGRYYSYMSVKGIRPETMEIFEFEASEGRLLETGDTYAIVFGVNAPWRFQDERSRYSYRYHDSNESNVDRLKDRLELSFDDYSEDAKPTKSYRVNGVGILKEGDYNNDYYAFMSIDQLKKMIDENNRNQKNNRNSGQSNQNKGYEGIMIKVKDIKDVTNIQNQIKDMGYNAYSLTDYLESMQNTASVIQAVLGGIGAVSLLVAALGITNTMIMSIYERTREIGIMKVIGASLSDIRRLFLLEAALIGFSGGIIGIAFSYLASYLLNTVGSQVIDFMHGSRISIIPLWLSLSTILFTTLVGIISGFYPARRAMKLSAIEAIKTE